MRTLVLASTSPYRRAQLEQLGLPFLTYAPPIDESSFKHKNAPISQRVADLSIAKAESLAQLYPNALIIGGDQMATIDGELLEKPGNREAAQQQLRRLIGRSHQLYSGVAVHDPTQPRTEVAVECHTMTMRQLPSANIDAYLDRDQPWDCVGSYKLESSGIALFSSIEGRDHTAIIGLPLMQLVTILETFGILLPAVP